MWIKRCDDLLTKHIIFLITDGSAYSKEAPALQNFYIISDLD